MSSTDRTPGPAATDAPTAAGDPGTAPIVPGAPVVKKTERPHPATPFIRGWIVLVALVIAWGQQLIPDGDGETFDVTDLRWILPVVAGIAVVAGLVGFASWWFTRFVIDDDELRVETGALFKNSKKIPFERLQSVDIIQPLAARVFGLAELRLEAGAGDSTVKLAYLNRAKASQLRDYLLTRAHGQRASVADLGTTAAASALTDLGMADVPLVRVSPQRLVVGFLLSTEWLVSALVVLILILVTTVLDVSPVALTAVFPLLLGTVSLVGRRVIAMFNFTLAESPRGLRITRGLTNLTSQSVPIDRIQGVKTTQPLLWRRLGWYRVDVDVVGYANGDSENNDSSATSVLLPVADAGQVALALGRVLPGIDLDGIERRPSPRRARWLRWFDFWTLRHGWNDRAVITEHGWLSHVVDIVPHAKTQSVRIDQGPWQRRLGLADVHFDTPRGPVRATAQELDVQVARELALGQLDRARAARAADRERVPVSEVLPHPDEDAGQTAILGRFGIDRTALLGSGGESEVYALDPQRVLRLYRGRHEAPTQVAHQLRYLYDGWARVDVGLEVPRILETGQQLGRTFTVDRRFSGQPFSAWLSEAGTDERRTALLSFLDATDRIRRLPSPVPGFARLVGVGAPQSYGTLGELVHAMLAGPVSRSRDQLPRDVPEIERVWERLHTDLARRQVSPVLVHGDVCPPNAYLSRAADGAPVVTGIGDFSPHTVHADPLLDLTGAVAFLELEAYPEAVSDALWLAEIAVERWGPEVGHWIGVYRRFYGFYFSDTSAADPLCYAWCVRQLSS